MTELPDHATRTPARTAPVAEGPGAHACTEAARALHPSAGSAQPYGRREHPLAEDTLAAIADGLAAVADDEASAAPGEVRRTRLLDTTGYDAWQIVWGPGSVAADHDHAGSISVLRLVTGSLTETVAEINGTTIVQHDIDADGTSALAIAGRHSLANRRGATAVSIHVYSPPLGEPDLGDPELF